MIKTRNVLLSLSLLLSACSAEKLQFSFGDAKTLSGKFVGFSQSSSLSSSGMSSLACSAAEVSVYRVNTNGERSETPLGTTSLAADGSYSFSLRSLGLTFEGSSSQDPVVVVAKGCSSGVYSRPITGSKNQDITMGSTLVGYLVGTQYKDQLSTALLGNATKVEALLKSLSGEQTFQAAYDALINNPTISNQFQDLFGTTPAVLSDAAPEIASLVVPSVAQELSALNLGVDISQWSSSYHPIFEWKLDSTVLAQTPNVTYTPGGNSQGAHTITLTVGQDNGTGQIDLAKPIKVITRSVTIANNILPMAPSFSVTTPVVVGTQPINNRSLTVTIDTGANKINCDSFSSLALTEGVDTVPSAASFNISCSQANSQAVSVNVTSAGDGTKTLRLWALDSTGLTSVTPTTFSFNLDTGVPSVSISTTPLAMSNTGSQSFGFSGEDNGGYIDRYECKMDGGSWTSCSSPQSYASLAEGDHTFSLRAMDTAGNASTVESKSWHIDLTAPVLTLTGTPSSITNSLAATFNFSATDSGGAGFANYFCQLDSAVSFTQCPAIQNYTLSAGTHVLKVKASDNAGNVSASQSYSWTIDTALPLASITAKPTALNNSPSASFSFTGSDTGGGAVASYECQIDGGSFAACVSPKVYGSLADGAHSFGVRAIDTAGNVGATVATYSWTVDLTTPIASINSGPDSITNSTSATFGFSANPPPSGSISGYECKLDAAAWSSCSSLKSYSGLAQGTHTFQVRSIDNNSNYSTATSQTWVVDTTVPVVTIGSAPTSLNNSTTASFSFSATDFGGGSVVGYQCKLDGGAYADCSSPTNLTGLAQGSHTYSVTAIDTAGNTSSAVSRTWTVDLTAPALTLSSTPNAVTNATTANFNFSATDSGGGVVAGYSCSLDGAAFAACTSVKSYTGLAAGAHTFAVVVADDSGNTSSATTFSWTVDLTAPTLSITSKPNSITNATAASFVFAGTDTGGGALANYSCKLDAGSYATCTSPQAYSSLAAGTHTFYVTATDTAGNTSSAQSYSWTIDTTPPVVAITTPSSNGTVALASSLANYSVGGTCSENGVAVVLSGASSLSVPCSAGAWSTNIDVSSLGDGTLSVTATQTDAAGNSTSSSAKTFVKDTVVPSITVTTPVAFQGGSSTGAVTWSLTEPNVGASTNFTVELYNGSSWSSVGTKAANAGSNSNQAYTLSGFAVSSVDVNTAKIRVSVSDAAGNLKTQESGTFIIDKSPPTVSSVIINDGAQYAGTALVSVKVNITDNYFTGSNLKIRLGLANAGTSDCQSEYADNNWQTWTNSSTNLPFTFVPTDGIKKICVWGKDLVGNVSAISPTAGTVNVDYDTIEYSTGNPPAMAIFNVTNASSGGYTALANEYLTIQWAATDVEGLDNAPVTISYTTDNVTWKDIITDLNISTASNKTWLGSLSGNPTSGSGTIATFKAPSSVYFKLKAQVKDIAGNTSPVTFSQAFNTGNWSIYAGNPDSSDGGIGKATQLSGSSYTSLFAVNPTNGDIYTVDNAIGIRKLDAKTGVVSTVIKAGTLNLPDNGNLPANPLVPSVNSAMSLFFDSKGRLYLTQPQTGSAYALIVYQIDFESGKVRLYAGGGVGDDGGSPATSLQLTAGFSFDEQDSLYTWAFCGGALVDQVNVLYNSVGVRLIKIQQNSDGTPGATSRIIGDCTKGTPTSGSTAYSQPALNGQFPGYSAITVWNNGNNIFISRMSTSSYKIINGVVYNSNISVNPTYSRAIYNPYDGLIYRNNSSNNVEKVSVNTLGANGDTTTPYFSAQSTDLGCSSDGTSISSYCGYVAQGFQIRSGIVYFVDGVDTNTTTAYMIRYFDASDKLRTVLGMPPFSGDTLDRQLARGTFSGIYYKKSSEANLTAFPEGLYFMESKGVVFGYVDPSNDKVSTLWGNQARLVITPTTGTSISKYASMGSSGANGTSITFDSTGLPWLRSEDSLVSIDTNKQVVRRTLGGNAQNAANNAAPANYGLYRFAGSQNFTLKNSGLFIMPNYVATGVDPIISLRYMNFTTSTMPIIIGGNYLASSNTAASADITTPGNVAAAPLWTTCRASGQCFMQYHDTQDRLYYSENTKLRYITTPDVPATSTLGTLFTSANGRILNFSFTPDKKQLWYFNTSGSLYCYDISSGKSWCNNTTDHFAVRSSAGFVFSSGANQMTWKDNQTMFLSTYNGLILQFNLPTTP
ncbi:MAG: beta strand repeat-containing protein [Bdellovibrio sp.]